MQKLKETYVMLVALVLLAGVQVVHAADVVVDLTWTAPTLREDGSVLGPTEVQRYNVYWSPDAVDYTLIGGTTELAYTAQHDLPTGPTAYTYLYYVTTVDTNNLESQASNIHLETFLVKPFANPNAPGGVGGAIRCGEGCVIDSVTTIEGMGISLR